MLSQKMILKTVLLAACAVGLASAVRAAAAPRVAVFTQNDFPSYNVTAFLSPQVVVKDLTKAGVRADALDADALADPSRLNVKNYAVLVLPYGNAYPQAAFANLLAYHKAGGSFVMTGVPFTHAMARAENGDWKDLGHDPAPALFGSGGIGVGGFLERGVPGDMQIPPSDPLGLSGLPLKLGDGAAAQPLDLSTLPPRAKVTPLLTAGGSPIAVMVQHTGDAFPGAVDVWTTSSVVGDDSQQGFAAEQLVERGAVAILARQGKLSPSKKVSTFAALERLSRPRVFANLTLPTPPRPYPSLQPKRPAPARHLLVADVRKLPRDEQLLLASLQGLVNRTEPRVFLLWNDDDQFWLNVMQEQGDTDAPVPVADPLSLLQTFKSVYNGAVVADPKVYVTPCIAVDIAGADDLLLATPALAERLQIPIKTDLRGKFQDNAEALRYVRTTLLPRLNPFLSICLDPPLLGSQVDDIIAAKGMAFWVTGPREQGKPGADGKAELEEMEATFAQMPLDAIVRGYWWHGDGVGLGERPGVALGSRFGKITTVSDYVTNFSVFSGVVVPSLKQKPQPPAPKLDPTKVYVAIALSDGDNLITWRDFWRGYYRDPLHGKFPVAYGIGPTLIDLAPTMARWHYEHAAPTDEFICDVSGAGYVYPKDWGSALKDRAAAEARYFEWTTAYMKRLDLHGLRVMEGDRADIARWGAGMPDVAFFMPDYGPIGLKGYPQYTYHLSTGQPVFRAASYGPKGQAIANDLRRRVGETRPAFINAFVQNWGVKLSDLKEMLDILGPEYVAVTPSQLDALYREANGLKAAQTP